MKRYLAPLGAILLLAASITAWAQSTGYEDVYTNFTKGLSPRGGLTMVYCGQNAENGTIYFDNMPLSGPHVGVADAVCDGLDGATESSQDRPISSVIAVRPFYLRCFTNGTLGSGETIAYQLRAGETNVPGMACTIPAASTACEAVVRGHYKIAAGVSVAMRVVQVSDNADDDSKCTVVFGID